MTEGLDLEAYLARIGYSGELDTTIETLTALHRAHVLSIPFENLDILLGRPIRLDLESLQAKLVRDRRGGYCFEQNALFAAVLEHLGFAVTGLAARVRWATSAPPRGPTWSSPSTSTGPRWLADVGFGGDTLLDPVAVRRRRARPQGAWAFRLVDDGDVRVLWGLRAEGWLDLYAFTDEPQLPVDYEVANHFTSTWPRSPFVTKVIAQRSGLDERWMLIEDELRVERPDGTERWTVASDAERLTILADRFGWSSPRARGSSATDAIPLDSIDANAPGSRRRDRPGHRVLRRRACRPSRKGSSWRRRTGSPIAPTRSRTRSTRGSRSRAA